VSIVALGTTTHRSQRPHATVPRGDARTRRRALTRAANAPKLALALSREDTEVPALSRRPRAALPVLGAALCSALASPLSAQAPAAPDGGASSGLDLPYTEAIRAATTNECFSTPWVDHLPASATVPTPLEVLGHIAGAPDVLSYSHEVHEYMRAVAAATPRVLVFSAGVSEEGREMILVAVSDEATIARLAHYREITRRLADPRGLDDAAAQALIAEGKPIYWATGAMHSPETGSPEMLMELVYRLAVEETPAIRGIRENVIFLTTPILEVDGRDKRVDLLKLEQDGTTRVPPLVYWGKYVAHDNNRDAIGLGLQLSRHLMSTFLEYRPQVLHDLHESVSHLYTSTGTGPYNAWLDPIQIDEWHVLAYQEITEMTKLGVPGVWTHGFYDGWAPHYGFYAANGHNAIGRFYETEGAGSANTRRIRTRADRTWYRPNPPLPETMWSIRNNVNLQQSALLIALDYVARHRTEFLENFWKKSVRATRKPWNEGPAGYVFPADDPRPAQQAELLALLARQGCEVHRTLEDGDVGELKIPAGSYVVRMDQPYSRMADMLLDRCYFNATEPRPYDDTGWTLGPLFNARVERVESTALLDLPMEELAGEPRAPGCLETHDIEAPAAYVIDQRGESNLATLRFLHPDWEVRAAEKPFEVEGIEFRAGAWILPAGGKRGFARELAGAAGELGFVAHAAAELPEVDTHPLPAPRIALVHTWTTTQNEGWMRLAFDTARIPYDYLSVHDVRDDARLREKFDVIVFGPSSSDALSIVNGYPETGEPIAWRASELAPNIGRQDASDDIRGGLELEGVVHLRDFVRAGGALIVLQNSCSLPVQMGLADGVSIATTEDLQCSGSVLLAEVADESSPIAWGFGDELGVFFRQAPVLRVGGSSGGRSRGRDSGRGEDRTLAGEARSTGRGGIGEPDRVQGRAPDLGVPTAEDLEAAGGDDDGPRRSRSRARTIVRFVSDPKKLLISGMLAGGDELAGTAAVVDAPLGDGHVVLFAINPMWRHITQGTWPLVFNAILHAQHLTIRAPRTM
jgi:hypothetical protein